MGNETACCNDGANKSELPQQPTALELDESKKKAEGEEEQGSKPISPPSVEAGEEEK